MAYNLPVARVWVRHAWVFDCAAAAVLTVGALLDAGVVSARGLPALAVVSSIVLTVCVAWSRSYRVGAALCAGTAFAAFELSSHGAGDGLFDLVAIVWIFYLLGRDERNGDRVLGGILACAYWVAACVLVGLGIRGSPLTNASFWGLSGILPLALARMLAARDRLTSKLEVTAAALREDQGLHAELAAAEERAKLARELHDVVAHCVSVMVVQTGGARRIARADPDQARDTLRVVERAGREALVEIRRIVGVLRHGDGNLGGAASPGIGQLSVLLDKAGAAGLPVELQVDRPRDALPPGLDLVIYRIVQEALTNVIKHAGASQAWVSVRFGAKDLELRVLDNGTGGERHIALRSGHGLVGMAERVRLYGGEFHAAPAASGGFEVVARIRLGKNDSAPQTIVGDRATARATRFLADDQPGLRWLDPLIAMIFLVALELTVVTSSVHGVSRFRDVTALAGMALAGVWRRRWPLPFVIVVAALLLPLSDQVSPRTSPVAAIYVGLIPAYTVAAWEERRNACLGLAVLAAAAALNQMIYHRVAFINYAGPLFVICAAWVTGRAVRSRRVAAATLRRATARLAAERDDRAELAIASERARIARDVHILVANSVAAMVLQAEAARAQLSADPADPADPPSVDPAMLAIQSTGRQALGEMRRILGVLRHTHDRGTLAPQPGVDQIHSMIQLIRDRGHTV